MKRLIIVFASAGAMALAGCGGVAVVSTNGGSGGSTAACMVTSQGSQVCGSAAVAWCQATSAERSNAESDPYTPANIKQQLQQTDADCLTMSVQ